MTLFTLQASKFDIYVHYCTNKPKSTEVLMAAGDTYFQVGCQNNCDHWCLQHSCCFHYHTITIFIKIVFGSSQWSWPSLIPPFSTLFPHLIIWIIITIFTIFIIIIISSLWSYYYFFLVIILATSRPQSQGLQRAAGVEQPISAYLIKPVQRLVYKFCAFFIFTF